MRTPSEMQARHIAGCSVPASAHSSLTTPSLSSAVALPPPLHTIVLFAFSGAGYKTHAWGRVQNACLMQCTLTGIVSLLTRTSALVPSRSS